MADDDDDNCHQYGMIRDRLDLFQFHHRKKARELAVSHLRNSIVGAISLIALLVMVVLPRMRGAPGGMYIFIGLVLLVGLTAVACLGGACSLFCATEHGTDPSVALDHAESWKVWCHLGRATSVIILILLPFIVDMSLLARAVCGLVDLVLILAIVGSGYMGNKHINGYIDELEEHFKIEASYSLSAPPPAPQGTFQQQV